MRLRIVAPLTAALVAGTVGLTAGTAAAAPSPSAAPAAAAAQPRATVAPIDLQSVATSAGTLTGTFTPTGFVNQGGQLAVVGSLVGTLTSATGTTNVDTTATAAVTDALAATPGSCQVLDLVLGPLHLDLLGLVVDLNQVHLTITAQQGPGNLLGNLLCAVAGLLDGNGVTGLAALLNQLLGL